MVAEEEMIKNVMVEGVMIKKESQEVAEIEAPKVLLPSQGVHQTFPTTMVQKDRVLEVNPRLLDAQEGRLNLFVNFKSK